MTKGDWPKISEESRCQN